MPDIIMADNNGGLIYDEYCGMYYKPKMNIEVTTALKARYQYAQLLEEVTVRGFKNIGSMSNTVGSSSNTFSNCPKLKKLNCPDGLNTGNSYIAAACQLLEEVILGSVGHPTSTTLYSSAFSGSGGSVVGEKTITLYVSDTATLPATGAPWGLTGATVVYRSATTGEILEVPTE